MARLLAVDITAFRLREFSLRRLLRLAGFRGVEVVDYVEQEFLRAEVQPGPVNFKCSYCWEGKPYSSLNRFESLLYVLLSLEYLSLEKFLPTAVVASSYRELTLDSM